jgi:CBS domain-containing protein
MLPVGELMRQDIAVAHPGAPVRRVVELMATLDVEGVLIADVRGRVIGSIGDEQLVASLHASRHRPWWRPLVADGMTSWVDERLITLTAGDIMLKRVVAVSPPTTALAAIQLFDEHAVNVLPVVDSGALVGAVFRADLVKRLLLPHPFGHPAED